MGPISVLYVWLNFFGGCVLRGFPKVGSREQIFLEKWGVLGTKICILRTETWSHNKGVADVTFPTTKIERSKFKNGIIIGLNHQPSNQRPCMPCHARKISCSSVESTSLCLFWSKNDNENIKWLNLFVIKILPLLLNLTYMSKLCWLTSGFSYKHDN